MAFAGSASQIILVQNCHQEVAATARCSGLGVSLNEICQQANEASMALCGGP